MGRKNKTNRHPLQVSNLAPPDPESGALPDELNGQKSRNGGFRTNYISSSNRRHSLTKSQSIFCASPTAEPSFFDDSLRKAPGIFQFPAEFDQARRHSSQDHLYLPIYLTDDQTLKQSGLIPHIPRTDAQSDISKHTHDCAVGFVDFFPARFFVRHDSVHHQDSSCRPYSKSDAHPACCGCAQTVPNSYSLCI